MGPEAGEEDSDRDSGNEEEAVEAAAPAAAAAAAAAPAAVVEAGGEAAAAAVVIDVDANHAMLDPDQMEREIVQADILFLKHDGSILRQSSNPVCGS